jgi:hypothetical protein
MLGGEKDAGEGVARLKRYFKFGFRMKRGER